MSLASLLFINWAGNLVDILRFGMVVVICIGLFGLMFFCFAYLDGDRVAEGFEKNKKLIKSYAYIFAVTLTLHTVSLDKKQIYEVFVIHQITNIKNADKLPENLVNAANKFLEEYSQEESKD
ncbi:hypothetical protein [Agarilytica rhodophyticola]|uniref:hypothetical protein n=1 Tax=Agarilytica rhodophyticola TaxID=1737490 RepID=UPI000B3488ED|nr:hypothetical protein [Agarilytica rhodophyticola]